MKRRREIIIIKIIREDSRGRTCKKIILIINKYPITIIKGMRRKKMTTMMRNRMSMVIKRMKTTTMKVKMEMLMIQKRKESREQRLRSQINTSTKRKRSLK